jgi:disulfide bond formation protein DsbB
VTVLFELIDAHTRRIYGLTALVAALLLAFGMYLQHVVGLEPCPMCIVQRYAFVLVALLAAFAATRSSPRAWLGLGILILLISGFGAFVAARQSYLQWYPPEVLSCGRDLYGMIENFPLQRVIPMVFKGSGDCTAVDWTFLGGSIANWSFLCFCDVAVTSALVAWRHSGPGRGDSSSDLA